MPPTATGARAATNGAQRRKPCGGRAAAAGGRGKTMI